MRSREATVVLIRKLRRLADGSDGAEAQSARARADQLALSIGGVPEEEKEAPPVVLSLGRETPETPFASILLSRLFGINVAWIEDGPAVVGRDRLDVVLKAGRYREACSRLRASFTRAVRRSAPAYVTSTGIVHWFGFSHEEPLTEAARTSYYWGVTQGFLSLIARRGSTDTKALTLRRSDPEVVIGPPEAAPQDRTSRVMVNDRDAVLRGRQDAIALGLNW